MKTKILVIENSFPGSWGKGDTLEEALKNAGKPRYYTAYRVHPSTTVSGMGDLQWNVGDGPECEPVEIANIQRKVKAK